MARKQDSASGRLLPRAEFSFDLTTLPEHQQITLIHRQNFCAIFEVPKVFTPWLSAPETRGIGPRVSKSIAGIRNGATETGNRIPDSYRPAIDTTLPPVAGSDNSPARVMSSMECSVMYFE